MAVALLSKAAAWKLVERLEHSWAKASASSCLLVFELASWSVRASQIYCIEATVGPARLRLGLRARWIIMRLGGSRRARSSRRAGGGDASSTCGCASS